MSTIDISYAARGVTPAAADGCSAYGRSVDGRWAAVPPMTAGLRGELRLEPVGTAFPMPSNQLIHEFDQQHPTGSPDCSPPV